MTDTHNSKIYIFLRKSNIDVCPRGGGGGEYMTCGWTGVCRPVFRKVPSSNYRKLQSYPLLWWILAENHPFVAIFRQFLDNPPLFMENLPKKGPLFREFGAQKPTHMGGTYPYPQHVMYPPGHLSHIWCQATTPARFQCFLPPCLAWNYIKDLANLFM